ncbi:MAG: BMP family ABC transporter substrate-binding protein [Lachnospiraceae bacterium]|nr:BMP family ABC transporter substrate-binding protein [Lachnospiraceae bacterium]
MENYYNARKKGLSATSKAEAKGESPYLPVLDSFLQSQDIKFQAHLGLMELPLDYIVGNKSESRNNAFANNFMPILGPKTEFADKWEHLYNSVSEEGVRDAITCYEYLGNYYVGEGNKRVSVSKYLNFEYILADVTRLIPVESDDRSYPVYKEYLRFYEATGIFIIRFRAPGSYEKLAYYMGMDLDSKWPSTAVEDLKSAYIYFDKAFKKALKSLASSSKGQEISASDAFLVYISIFPYKSLLDDSSGQILSNIRLVQKELATDKDLNNIIILNEAPEKKQKSGPLSGLFKNTRQYTALSPLRIAFIYDAAVDESRWIDSHEAGRLYAQEILGEKVHTDYYIADKADSTLSESIKKAIDDKNEVIITVSPDMLEETLKYSVTNPSIKFMNCSIGQTYSSVRSYFARFSEAAFLSGILAANVLLTSGCKEHKIGYLCDSPGTMKTANINAFALGASMMVPDCSISLKWLCLDEDSDYMNDWKNEGIEIYADIEHSPNNCENSRKKGVFLISPGDGRDKYICSPYYNWGKYYANIFHLITEGLWDAQNIVNSLQATNYYFGLSTGVVDLRIGDLPYETVRLMEFFKASVASGLTGPFSGEIHSTGGIIQKRLSDRATSLSDSLETLNFDAEITMNWLNDNVCGTIPTGSK